MLRGFIVAALAALTMVQAATWVSAQSRTTRIVVAFPPGGPIDLVARIMSDQLAKELGQSVIIENKAGASGAIGAEYVARGPADGSMVFLTSLGAIVLNPMLHKDLPYNAEKDFAPVSLVVSSPTVFVVNAETAAKDAVELVSLSKSAQKPFAIGSAGVGGTTHIAYEMFQSASGANLLHVPYKGAGPVIGDLLNKQIGGFFGDLPGVIANIQAGKFRALGILSNKRHPAIPEVKTMAELGFKDVESDNWYAFVVPAKTPKEAVAALNAATRRTLAAELVRTRLIAAGAEIIPSSPEEVTARIASDIQRWGRIIRERGIKIE